MTELISRIVRLDDRITYTIHHDGRTVWTRTVFADLKNRVRLAELLENTAKQHERIFAEHVERNGAR